MAKPNSPQKWWSLDSSLRFSFHSLVRYFEPRSKLMSSSAHDCHLAQSAPPDGVTVPSLPRLFVDGRLITHTQPTELIGSGSVLFYLSLSHFHFFDYFCGDHNSCPSSASHCQAYAGTDALLFGGSSMAAVPRIPSFHSSDGRSDGSNAPSPYHRS